MPAESEDSVGVVGRVGTPAAYQVIPVLMPKPTRPVRPLPATAAAVPRCVKLGPALDVRNHRHATVPQY